jgi:hypothetical protein
MTPPADANCGKAILASQYPATFTSIYLCGQCKGGCPQVDGGAAPTTSTTSVPCAKFANIGEACDAAAGLCCGGGPKNTKCDKGKCVSNFPSPGSTAAPVPAPAPTTSTASVPCAKFANIGEACDAAAGLCCGGGPKNTKCDKGKCVSNYPPAGK